MFRKLPQDSGIRMVRKLIQRSFAYLAGFPWSHIQTYYDYWVLTNIQIWAGKYFSCAASFVSLCALCQRGESERDPADAEIEF